MVTSVHPLKDLYRPIWKRSSQAHMSSANGEKESTDGPYPDGYENLLSNTFFFTNFYLHPTKCGQTILACFFLSFPPFYTRLFFSTSYLIFIHIFTILSHLIIPGIPQLTNFQSILDSYTLFYAQVSDLLCLPQSFRWSITNSIFLSIWPS